MSRPEDALDRHPADARQRLEALARAVDRIHVDDLVLHVARRRGPRHRRAVETAELVAVRNGLVEPIAAARRLILEGVLRSYANAGLRVGVAGVNPLGGGAVDDRVRVAESLSEAKKALVLWDPLDADPRAELLGLWERLLP